MSIRTIFKTCRPRSDVLQGTVAEADFAADLAQVVTGEGSAEYVDPARFFANTYPTRGLKNLLANVCRRLSGAGGEAAAIFRLNTSYGGDKTHGLIALAHAARGSTGVAGVEEFIDPALLPQGPVRLAAFDGENADPANGRTMGESVRARTPWGEIAYALAGTAGYERVKNSDTSGVSPGADTLRELFGGQSTLILLDELSVYLSKVQQMGTAREQLTAFLTSLFKAVEGTPRAALVYTLAISKEGRAVDAYSAENQFIADRTAEAESVSARKATLLNPTEEDETAQVLRRRLFESIDEDAAREAVDAYQAVWSAKTRTTRAVRRRPTAFGPGCEPIRQEIVTRLQQSRYVPAIANDVAGSGGSLALAEDLDAKHHGGMPPYATYVARTIFMHTMAFNDPLKGLLPEQLCYSMLGPSSDVSFIEEARKKFILESAYLDDRPGAPMRFLAEANLTQIIRREEKNIDSGDARAELNDRIGQIFKGGTFDAIRFPGGPFDVPDDVGNGRPKLVVLAYDAVTIGTEEDIPALVRRIYLRKGSDGSALRLLRNNVVFVVADEARKAEMRRHASRRLALRGLKKPERLAHLAEHQRDKVCELEARSEQELALAIQQCYRHVFYPSRHRVESADVDLAHSAIDTHSTSDQPGAGQRHIARVLADLNKLRYPEDEPDSPAYVRDRTPLKKGPGGRHAVDAPAARVRRVDPGEDGGPDRHARRPLRPAPQRVAVHRPGGRLGRPGRGQATGQHRSDLDAGRRLADVVVIGLQPGVDGPARRVLAKLGRQQQLRSGRDLLRVQPHVVHRMAPFLGSWGLSPIAWFVPLPRSARQKKSAQSARDFSLPAAWAKAAGGVDRWRGGKGSGHMMDRWYQPPSPPCAPYRAGSPEVGGACAADGRGVRHAAAISGALSARTEPRPPP